MMIELRQFRQFVAVAEEMNFRRAAERLHMAQPPLTAAIRRIEAELGVMLIERSNRIERLTAAGGVFLIEARRAIAQSERAIELAKRAGHGLAGTLRVAFVATAAHDLLPGIVRAFRAQHWRCGARPSRKPRRRSRSRPCATTGPMSDSRRCRFPKGLP